MNKVFVSYSRRNKNFAERIARDLSDAGLEVWIDFRQIHAGELWQEEIYRGIERSDIVVVCLSPDAAISEWVQREVNTAREQGKFIIPVMAVDALEVLGKTENMRWLLDVHFIIFENRYGEAFPELLDALPGKRRVGAYDVVDPDKIPNPFKGLEAFQQTDSHFFFGRESLIRKSIRRLRDDRETRFLAVVGASGSGKSSLVRAGVLPELRGGVLPGSEHWRMVIFTPGSSPVEALAQRLAPLVEERESEDIVAVLHESPDHFDVLIDQILQDAQPEARLLLVVDQFEEVFTRSGEGEREVFLSTLNRAVTVPDGRALVLITMRADFFDHLSHYPDLAELFEKENMVIVTEMTPAELLRSIEGPATAVGLVYDDGLPQRILDEVRRQPGSLPLLQYALKELYMRRSGNRLTSEAYNQIGGVQKALAGHAETIYVDLGAAEQAIMRRILLQLVEVGETGEATRRKVDRADLQFRDVPDEAVQELLDLLTSAESRLLIASRQIATSGDVTTPTVWIEVGHEALIRQWDRFTGWVAENQETLRYGTELMLAASDWRVSHGDKAYLVTGNRLIRAEAWLQVADATELQREFIQASMVEGDRQALLRQQQMERELQLQRRATSRARGFVALMFIALVIAVVLSAWAIRSQNDARAAADREAIALQTAIANEELALAAEQQAISLALASGADRAMADDDRELAILLAVEANEIESPPPQAQRTLADVAYTPGTRYIIDEEGVTITDATFSPDGTHALYVVDNLLVLWNVLTGEEIRAFDNGADEGVIGHTQDIQYVALSPDGTRAVSAGEDGLLLVWDVETGSVVGQFAGNGDVVNCIVFSPSGAQLLGGGNNGVVILWDVDTGAITRQFTGHTESVNAVAFSPDGQFVLSGSDDETARLWRIDGQPVRTFARDNDGGRVTSVAFHPTNDTRIITGGDDNLVLRWNINDGTANLQYEQHDGNVNRIAYSPDGTTLVSASSDDTLIWWKESNGAILDTFSEHSDDVLDVAFSPDGDYILSTSSDGTARLWDIKQVDELQKYAGHTRQTLGGRNEAVGVYGPDGTLVLSGATDSSLRLWDSTSGLTIQQFLGHSDSVNDVAMSDDGTTVLSGSDDQKVMFWDVASGQPLQTLFGHESPVLTVNYLPEYNRAISGGADGGLILWNLQTGEIVRRFGPAIGKGDIGHTDAVYDVAISPDGSRMLSASADDTLLLWNIETGEIINEFKGHNDEIRSVTYDATGERAVSGAGNGTLIMWDVSDDATVIGGVLRRLFAHDDAIHSVDFSPDGLYIISASEDHTLRLWDVETGFELRRYSTENKTGFHSVDFRTDGAAVLTGMDDSTLREWQVIVAPDALIAWALNNRYVREPSCEERQQYRLTPLCADGVATPTRTPVVTPTPNATPEARTLIVGETATVNTSDGESLRVRANPSTETEILATLEDGATVTLLDGPVAAGDYSWWYVRTEDGVQGWAVESIPEESLQTLLP